jgi:hypothetical protein
MLAAPAAAQPQPTLPANCQGFTAAPTLPDGATASASAIEDGNTTFTTWHEGGMAKLGLCRTDIDALRAQLRASEDAYNAAVGQLNAARDAWLAEVNEYNARGGDTNSRRERGGVRTR